MTRTVDFYKDDNGRWYINLLDWIDAGGSVEALEMVFGADQLLDILSHNSTKVTLQISDNKEMENYLEKATNTMDNGMFYIWKHHVAWLCDVTVFLFGEWPQRIYFKVIEQ